jgi:hypothetical protein
VYAPALLKVAVVFFAALVPFAEKVGFAAPAGTPVAAHVYVRFESPPPSLSAPRTERLVLVPVTVLGEAAVAVATVGVASVTAMLAVPLTLPLVAVIVAEPAAYDAV